VLKRREKGVQEMFTKEGMIAFDEALRIRMVARQKELRLSDKALGQMAFPFMGNPLGKVRSILIAQGAGEDKKPQNIRTADLYNLCQALGLMFHDEIRAAVKIAEQKQSPS
jgi:hypothetical protein